MIGHAVFAVFAVLVAVAAGADASAVPSLDVYRLAETRREVGVVSGRAYAERSRPSTADIPFRGVAVTLVPYSDALVAAVENLKATARDSMSTYRRAATAMKEIRDAYELALWRAGAADLVRSDVTSAEGTFSIAGVPSGRWLVMARRETWEGRPWRRPAVREREVFLPAPEVAGFRTVDLWLVPVMVVSGGTVELELIDRGVWFRGIEEEKKRGTAR